MTRNRLLKRVTALVLTLVVFCTGLTVTAFAEDAQKSFETFFPTMYRISEDGNWFPLGGTNEYGGLKAQNREETIQLEARLRRDNYICVSGEFPDITDEEYQIFRSYGWGFARYTNAGDEYYRKLYRVYVYKPSYDDFMEQYTKDYNSLEVSMITEMEIMESTVIITYVGWNSLDDVGKVFNNGERINENIDPLIKYTGYLQITSPIDTTIRLRDNDNNVFFEFYIVADTPFLVKMATGLYYVDIVNDVEIVEGSEDTLPRDNVIHLTGEYTEEEPYIVDLGALAVKYNLKPSDIFEKPDLSLHKTQQMPVERTVVGETTVVTAAEREQQIQFKLLFIMLGIILLVAIAVLIKKPPAFIVEYLEDDDYDEIDLDEYNSRYDEE